MLSPNPHTTPPPTSFALACRMAERAAANVMGMKPRPRVEWKGVTYFQCIGCEDWKHADDFHRAAGIDNRQSRCKVCTKLYDAQRPRCRRVKAKVRRPTPATKPKPAPPVSKPVMSCMSRLQPLAFEGNHVPDAARVEPASRWGNEEADRAPGDFERQRFAKARQYNPALTWDEWLVLTRPKPRGRRPKQSPAPEGARA